MVTIKCSAASELSLDEMSVLQGQMKYINDQNIARLRKQIIDHGFTAPFFIWKDGKKNWILDGHQRHFVLLRMAEQGVEIPLKFPVVEIKASNMNDAKLKLLGLASQYGTVHPDGLAAFASELDLNPTEFNLNFSFDKFNVEDFEKAVTFKGDSDPNDTEVDLDDLEASIDDLVKCPKCSHEFRP